VPQHEPPEFESCAVCERTLLVGERSWDYVSPGGEVRGVCTLCKSRAEASGWVPAGLGSNASLPAPVQRASRFGFLRRPGRGSPPGARLARSPNGLSEPDEQAAAGAPLGPFEPAPEGGMRAYEALGPQADEEPEAGDEPDPEPEPDEQPVAEDPEATRDSADEEDEAGAETLSTEDRAIRIFNESEKQEQVGRLRRTLGDPKVSIRTTEDGGPVIVLVAWELSWYEWEVSVDSGEPRIEEVRKGDELAELGDPGPDWNAGIDEEGLLTPGAA
jgi:hypothetical protein